MKRCAAQVVDAGRGRVLRRLRCFADCAGGASAVEFALVGLPAAMLMIGILEMGRGLHLRGAIDDAVDRAQRVAVIDRDISDVDLATTVRLELRSGLGQSQGDAAQVTVSTEATSTASYKVITVELPMRLLLPNPITRDITISSSGRLAPQR